MHVLIALCFVLIWLGNRISLCCGAEPDTSGIATPASASPSPGISEGDRWSFVVFGDTRDAKQDTQTGISPLLGRLAESIAAEKPALVIHIGDLINGYYILNTSLLHGNYSAMFKNWKAAVRPIYDFDRRAGVPIYIVRGNHEDGKLVTDKRLKDAYLNEIATFMPQTGPEQEEGLTYSISYKQATFIGLDEYSIKELGVLRGLVNQPWLNEQLSRRKSPFMFVFGHVPAYQVSDGGGGPFPDLYYFKEHRDAFWISLRAAGVSMYFCGHVHFYCRVTKDGIQQVLIGNGGANTIDFDPKKVDPAVTLNYPVGPMKASDVKTGYVLFTVDAHTVTAVQKLLNEQTGEWETGDTFTTKVPL
jgi:hypothetical protein